MTQPQRRSTKTDGDRRACGPRVFAEPMDRRDVAPVGTSRAARCGYASVETVDADMIVIVGIKMRYAVVIVAGAENVVFRGRAYLRSEAGIQVDFPRQPAVARDIDSAEAAATAGRPAVARVDEDHGAQRPRAIECAIAPGDAAVGGSMQPAF